MTEGALSRWGDALRAAKARRRSLRRHALAIGAGIACLAATVALPPRPRLVWNASASAPIGLYVVTPPDRIGVGDMVIAWRSEEHTSELQSLMRISYAVFCLKKKKKYTI